MKKIISTFTFTAALTAQALQTSYAQQTGTQAAELKKAAQRTLILKVKSCDTTEKFFSDLERTLYEPTPSATDRKDWQFEIERTLPKPDERPILPTDASETEQKLEVNVENIKPLVSLIRQNNSDTHVLSLRPLDEVVEQGWEFGEKGFYRKTVVPNSDLDSIELKIKSPDGEERRISLSQTLIFRALSERERSKTPGQIHCAIEKICQDGTKRESRFSLTFDDPKMDELFKAAKNLRETLLTEIKKQGEKNLSRPITTPSNEQAQDEPEQPSQLPPRSDNH